MTCDRCASTRVASMSAKCSDRCSVNLGEENHDGYVPYDIGIGGGDYIQFAWCLACGKIQNDERGRWKFPLPACALEVCPDHDAEDDNSAATCMRCGDPGQNTEEG